MLLLALMVSIGRAALAPTGLRWFANNPTTEERSIAPAAHTEQAVLVLTVLRSCADRISPLRTDSRQLVSKIYWWQSAKNGIMREPEWREPTGFVWFAPAGGGNVWVDVNRRIIQNYPHGRGFYVTEFACLVPALPA